MTLMYPLRMYVPLLLATLAQSGAGQLHGISIKSYSIEAAIAPHSDTAAISVSCVVQRADTAAESTLLLSSNIRALTIQRRTTDGWLDVPFRFTGRDTLRLTTAAFPVGSEPFTLKFKYGFPITPPGDTLILLDRGMRWYPLVPDQISKLELQCEVPEGFTVLSAGELAGSSTTGGRSRFTWKSALPVFKVPMVIFSSRSMNRTTLRAGDKEIVLYYSAKDTGETAPLLHEAGRALAFFSEKLGDYPFKALTLVEIPYFQGVDVSTGLLKVGSPSLKAGRYGQYDMLHLSIAEQWIGAGAFAGFGQPGFWFLTVSLPHYLRLMYIRESGGDSAFTRAMQEPMGKYSEVAGTDRDIPILNIDYPNSREKGLVIYGKGPAVIGRLHERLGDERWKDLIRALCAQFRGGIMTFDDFRTAISKRDPTGGVLPMFDRMMTQKGMPEE